MEMSHPVPEPRVGLLGGTFNPVHTGHIRHALEAGEALGLELVLLTPAAVPPHKAAAGLLPFALRVEMARAAAQCGGARGAEKSAGGHVRLGVNTLEGELSGPSYTFVSLTAWRGRHPGVTPFFLMGVEDFTQLHTWRRGLELPRLARLVVVSRAGGERELFRRTLARCWPGAVSGDMRDAPHGAGGSASGPAPVPASGVESARLPGGGVCYFVPAPRLDISSSLVRERWMAGRDIRGLVPDAVRSIMESRRDEIRRIWAAPY
ncbi:MAG: nicotinate-nicotinamide nucleotide adenylyltransferase [Desulfovibrionaceae bacterium]|nr:nicotinate-nicotinamide nucleotide adenylyltransferase [Desulfovibrionaceae bacterium]